MSLKILWKSTIFLITLALIYLAFPILIVPSSLPPIQSVDSTDAQIYQLEIPQQPTLKNTIENLRERHHRGMDLILNRASL